MASREVPICKWCGAKLFYWGQIACVACGRVQHGT